MSAEGKYDPGKPEQLVVEKERTAKRHRVAEVTAVVAGLLGVVVAASTFFFPKLGGGEVGVATRTIELELKSLEMNLAGVQQQLRSAAELADRVANAKPADVQVAKLRAEVDGLQSEVKQLTEAVVQSPEKALAVPLLRKDIDNLRESYRRDLDATQSEMNRVYDLNKWFLGTVITMALALVGLAVSNFLQLKKGDE